MDYHYGYNVILRGVMNQLQQHSHTTQIRVVFNFILETGSDWRML